jgi:predicted kinase
MSQILCHFLIGAAGCGKSTFASLLNQIYPAASIISTDKIRLSLFGDESIQGDWSLIEQQVITQIHDSIKLQKSVIYDATNVKKEWRLSLLQQINPQNVDWLAWYLATPLDVCKTWNKKRDRQVPEEVIEALFLSLQTNLPEQTEGFIAVNIVDVWSKKLEIQDIKDILDKQNLS